MLSRLLPPEYKCLDEMGNQESTLSGDSIVQGVSSGISITGANSTDLPVDLNIKDAATTNVCWFSVFVPPALCSDDILVKGWTALLFRRF